MVVILMENSQDSRVLSGEQETVLLKDSITVALFLKDGHGKQNSVALKR